MGELKENLLRCTVLLRQGAQFTIECKIEVY
jgi:hypothetical protein